MLQGWFGVTIYEIFKENLSVSDCFCSVIKLKLQASQLIGCKTFWHVKTNTPTTNLQLSWKWKFIVLLLSVMYFSVYMYCNQAIWANTISVNHIWKYTPVNTIREWALFMGREGGGIGKWKGEGQTKFYPYK